MRILIVEPWLDGSHRQWAEGYRQASSHQVDIVGLPGELWRWRLRGGALPLAALVTEWVRDHGPPHLLLVSGLVDVAQLLGLARSRLEATIAVVVYQHESQLADPSASSPDQEAALRNWMSWCAADAVLFNSHYHQQAVVDWLIPFLSRLPDRSHVPMAQSVMAKFEVLPLGVDLQNLLARRSDQRKEGPPVVLWPHRWEADKDPVAFLAALTKAAGAGHDFRLVLAGEDPAAGSSQSSDARRKVVERFGSQVVANGPFDVDRYRELLTTADLVVSCAVHEFFGIGVVEATAAGCVPLLPDHLSYPEVIPAQWHDQVLYEPGRFASALIDALADLGRRRQANLDLAAAGVFQTINRRVRRAA